MNYIEKYLKDNTLNTSSNDEAIITKSSSKTNKNHNAISCDNTTQCSDQRVALFSLTEKNEKFNSNFSDDERGNLINNTEDKLLSFTSNVNNISLEIKALQRSIAILKQDLPKILRDELIKIKGGL